MKKPRGKPPCRAQRSPRLPLKAMIYGHSRTLYQPA